MSKRTIAILLLPALCAAAGDLNTLLEGARSAPPEFAADALIRLAAQNTLPRERRLELLHEAFERGGHAQLALKRHSALPRPEGPARFLNRAYDQDLDSLSLRLRAVEAALPLDAAQARAWLATVQPPAIPAVHCEDFMAYDAGRLYDTLALAAASYPEQERANGAAFRLLRRYTAAITSPVEIAPLAKLLAAAPVSNEDFVALISIFGTALGKITGDDRSFTYSRTVGPQIQALAAECKRRNVSPLPLIESYRFYLVTNLSAARCADDEQLAGGGGVSFGLAAGITLDPLSSDYIRFFNEKLRTGMLSRIGEEEATPARLEGTITGLRTCQDEECRSIARMSQELVMSPEGKPYDPALRNTEAWRKKFDAVLAAIADWKESKRETPLEQFREKSDAYSLLLNVAPDTAAREAAVRAEIAFLTKNPVSQTNRAEWLVPVNALLARIALEPAAFGKAAAELRTSGDPVIALYAKLEEAAPRRPDEIMRLL